MKKYSLEYARETFGKHITENEVVAIDGKTIRRPEYVPTGENKRAHKAAHVVSAWAHSLGVCFGQVKTEEKSNEITAIPELLDLLDLKGMIITIDAMGCQKKIVEKIAEKEAEYVISLKGNQQPRRRASGCCSHKVIAVGFNTLCYDTIGIKSSARISNRYTGM